MVFAVPKSKTSIFLSWPPCWQKRRRPDYLEDIKFFRATRAKAREEKHVGVPAILGDDAPK